MKCYLILYLCLLSCFITAQSTPLTNFEVILVGPQNVDRYHPVQLSFYSDYFNFLLEEVDIWLQEINLDIKKITSRNRKRLRKKKPIKQKDYPDWKAKKALIKSLGEDRVLILTFKKKWSIYDEKPDSVMQVFIKVYKENHCFDLISPQLVLSPQEYSISEYPSDSASFSWNEYIPKITYSCPKNYSPNGKTCKKIIKMETSIKLPSTFAIQNLLHDLPFHLDGFKRITCY